MASLTILEPRTEARARAGHGDHESAGNRMDLTPTRSRRVDARAWGVFALVRTRCRLLRQREFSERDGALSASLEPVPESRLEEVRLPSALT
jgi:hypothetical protein